MNFKEDIYKDFEGYTKSNIVEALKMIGERHLTNCGVLMDMLDKCETRVREAMANKILERIISIKNKMINMKIEFETKIKIIDTASQRLRIEGVEEEELKKIDYSIAENMTNIHKILDSMSCLDKDLNSNEKFVSISNYLDEINDNCKKRFHIVLKEA